MSICPYCLQKEKNFFSSKCDQCNTYVRITDQIKASLVYLLSTTIFWAGFVYLISLLI